jgi:translation initiation factor IF-1
MYKPRNFQGALKEIVSTNIPGSIKVMVDGKIYTVKITDKTSILNTVRNKVSLNRFETDDTIRIYGAIREVDEPIIDAEIVRNISL